MTQYCVMPVITDSIRMTQHCVMPVITDSKRMTQYCVMPVITDSKRMTQHCVMPGRKCFKSKERSELPGLRNTSDIHQDITTLISAASRLKQDKVKVTRIEAINSYLVTELLLDDNFNLRKNLGDEVFNMVSFSSQYI
nr:uncharacterized protein LOC123753941 [Procambarus clarkii]